MSNARNLSWQRLTSESVAIIVSILLAFSIDAWWNDRQERVRELRQIQALIGEFDGNRDRLKVDLDQLRLTTSLLEELIDNLSSVAADEETAVEQQHFWSIRYSGIADPSTGTLDAMISSGGLGQIQGESLRSSLSDWSTKLGEVQTDQLSLRNFTAGELIPYLGSIGDYSDFLRIPVNDTADPRGTKMVNSTNRLRTSVAYKLLMSKVALRKLEDLVSRTDALVQLLNEYEAVSDV